MCREHVRGKRLRKPVPRDVLQPRSRDHSSVLGLDGSTASDHVDVTVVLRETLKGPRMPREAAPVLFDPGQGRPTQSDRASEGLNFVGGGGVVESVHLCDRGASAQEKRLRQDRCAQEGVGVDKVRTLKVERMVRRCIYEKIGSKRRTSRPCR